MNCISFYGLPDARSFPNKMAIAQPENEIEVAFVFDGVVDIVSVGISARCTVLRAAIAKSIEKNARTVRLFVLSRPDGTWPDERTISSTEGIEIQYTRSVGDFLTPSASATSVHFRAELSTDDSKTNPEKENEAGASDLETSLSEYNSVCEKSRKRKARAQKLTFSSFDSKDIDTLYKKVKRVKYTQTTRELPTQYADAMVGEYERRVEACGEPWLQSESQRRIFINSVLVNCVAAANKESTEKLSLTTERELREDDIDGTGKADYIISKGDRMVVVIEAKKCDIGQGQEQNFAAMEAARIINRKTDATWHSIQGICTDFQNWVFIRRDSGILQTDHESTRVTTEFSEDMKRIAAKVYGMLLEL